MTTTFTVSVAGTEAVREKLAQIGAVLGGQALAETVIEVERFIERRATLHHKHGALVRSIYKKKVTPTRWVVGHDLQHAPHALFVQFGTRPHTIAPKDKKALRWASGGVFFFAKGVRHPGTKPDRYLEEAAALAPAIFAAHVERKLRSL